MREHEIEIMKKKSRVREENPNLKALDIFLSVHFLLVDFWLHNQYGDLPPLLSSMSPMPFNNIIPIDDVIAYDWNEIIGDKDQLSAEEGYEAMLRFLEKETEWLKELKLVINELRKDYENREGWWDKWLELYHKVKEGGE